MKAKFSSQKKIPNCPSALHYITKALEVIGWPFLFLYKKISCLFLKFLILVGETTATLILLPLKILLFVLRKLKNIKLSGVKNKFANIYKSLHAKYQILNSFKATLPHVPSVKVELKLSRLLFRAIFWPCYFTGRISYELITFPLKAVKRIPKIFAPLINRKFFGAIKPKTIEITRPAIKLSKYKINYQYKLNSIINYFVSKFKKPTRHVIKVIKKSFNKFFRDLKKVARKKAVSLERSLIRWLKLVISFPAKIIKSVFSFILGILSSIGKIIITVITFPVNVTSVFLNPKVRAKRIRAIKQKYFFFRANLLSFRKDFINSLISPIKSSKKKARNNIRSFSNFISKNNDPVLRPFLFFIRTPRRGVASSLIVIGLFASVYSYLLKDLPSPYNLVRQKKAVSSRIFDRNGKLLFTIYNGNENRTMVKLTELPDYVYNASIAIEDKDFYRHHGLSIKGVIRAAERNFFKNSVVEGGSTITQQLVKNALLTNERTIKRKAKELILAFETELIFSKKEILEMYLNEVPYGGPTYGIQEAARLFFGKQAKDLTLSEAALLAGLPAAPTAYSPNGLNKDYAKTRQLQVLKNMVSEHYITQEEAGKAAAVELTYSPNLIAIKAPHFVMWVRDLLNQKYGRKVVEEGGLDIYTTLDLDLQEKAEEIVRRNVEQLEKPYWISNSAALVTNPKTGEILAMVGSRDFFDLKHDGNVNVTIMPRQPGSSIKVVNYAYALGHGMTPNTIINDSPVTYRNAWESYTPVNYDGKYRGNVTLKQALAMSLNIPAVKTLATYGPDKMVEQGMKMGIKSWKNLKNYGLSLTLGAGEITMTELATAYGSIANYGKRVDLNPIKKIVNYQGMVLEDTDIGLTKNSFVTEAYAKSEVLTPTEPVMSPFVAYELIDILSDNKARLPTFGPYAKLEIPGHRVAVKTGTTDNKKDNWTFGFTPTRLVATWVGNNDNKPMNPSLASGITGAAPIWNEIMTEILKDKPDEEFPRPEGMIEVEVCEANGLLPCQGCPKTIKQYFIPGQEPTRKCYFPSPSDCAAKKAQLEKDGKKPEEIVAALAGCPLSAPASPKP